VDTFIKLRPENFLKSRDNTNHRGTQQLNIRTLGGWVDLLFSDHTYSRQVWNCIEKILVETCDDEIGDDETIDQFIQRHSSILTHQQLADAFNNAQSHIMFCIQCESDQNERIRIRKLIER